MLKKLMAIILVVELGLMFLPEKYIFASDDEEQTEETATGETDEATVEDPTLLTIPEMSGIEENTTTTETQPITDVLPDEAPVEEETPVDPTTPPTESNNIVTPQNDIYTPDSWFTFDPSTNTIIGYSSSITAPKNISIPISIGGIPVYHIKDSVFAGQQLTGLTLPTGLKTIGNNAFSNNPNMTGNLVIPDSVTSIGSSAFQTCGSLQSVKIGNGVTGIMNNTFDGCKNLNSVTIGSNVTSIGSSAFGNCSNLWGITIPNHVTSIGASAFASCISLNNVTIPDGVTGIADKTFYGCSNLSNIIIGNNVTSIGASAFYYCLKLTSITIPASVTSITSSTFNRCDNLTSINIPGKSKGSISGEPWGAVNGVVCWKEVQQVGDYLFDSSINTIMRYTGTAATVSIPNTLNVNGATYPVLIINDNAFRGNTALTSVTIPSNVVSIGSAAFSECNNLSIIDIPNKNKGGLSGEPWGASNAIVLWKDVKQVGDYLFYTTGGNIIKYTGTTAILKIPSTLSVDGTSYPVKIISESAFSDNKAITQVTIPNSVTSIGDQAFESCSSLTKVTIGSGVTSIHSFTFFMCSALTRIDIPGKNEGEIKGSPPWGANNVIVYWKDTKEVGDYVFNTTSGTITKYSGTATILNIPSSLSIAGIGYPVKKIDKNAFYDNDTLTKVTIPNSVTEIGVNAFLICNALTRIDIPNKNDGEISGAPWGALNAIVYWKDTKQIGDYLFSTTTNTIIKYTGSAATLKIPSEFTVSGVSYPVKKIGKEAFYNNKTLTNVEIPNSVTDIGDYAFRYCIKLSGATIGNSVTSIGYSAFDGCNSLTSITIPNSVTSIDDNAFRDCTALTDINIPGKNEGEIKGAPWGAPTTTAIHWKNQQTGGSFTFDYKSGTLQKYAGKDPVVTIPSYFTVDDTDYPVKAIGNDAFSGSTTLTHVIIPDTVTSIGIRAFQGCRKLTNATIGKGVLSIGNNAFADCSSLTRIEIPDSVTKIDFSAFEGCTSLTEAVISKNITSMGGSYTFHNTSLKTIFMRASRETLSDAVISTQPWGAPASTKVWYAGDIVTFDHEVKRTAEPYKRVIDIRAFITKPNVINQIILPNGTVKYVAKSDWPNDTGYYHYGSISEEAITTNGTYVFKGYGTDNVERTCVVEIDDIGAITLRANEASITEQEAPSATEQDILDLLNVSAEDEAGVLTSGTDCTFWISPEDMAKIHALRLGNVVTIRVNVKSSRSGHERTNSREVTLNTTSCVISGSNVELWPPQITNLTKGQLLGMMNVSVVDSEGATDMTKLVMSDEDFNKIKTGTIGTYNVLLTYDTNKAKKRVRVTIMDDSPAALINIPSEIKMNEIANDPVYGVGAEEMVSIVPSAVPHYPLPFKIETDPIFWLKSTAPDATGFNRMKVVVLNANNQPLPNNHLLATLTSSSTQFARFKLRGYHNEWNLEGTYTGIMTFTITYGNATP